MLLPIDQQPKSTPQPFLGPLFQAGVEPEIEAGYLYSPEEAAMHGIGVHRAIDFALARGTEIVVPADGWAVCTYGETQLTKDGEPRLIGMEEALRYTDHLLMRPPEDKEGPWPAWFGSFVVQIWHGQGRYTQYAHVDWVNPRVPFYAPIEKENGDLGHHPILRATVADYKHGKAVKVKKGELLATVGMTGCGWGRRCYETAGLGADGRPDFRNSDYTYWDRPHLHFMTFGKRVGKKRSASEVWDPFGIYGDGQERYPAKVAEWSGLPGALWQ